LSGMSKLGYGFLAVLSVVTLFSCDEKTIETGFVPSIVVEGSIELNGFPKVILTRNIPYYVEVDSADLIYIILRQAKVTVSDGERSEILTLKFRKDEFPPFFYEGNEITGRAGKTYLLTVQYGEKTLTSTTTIPQPVYPDSIWFQPNIPDDGMGKISVSLTDNPDRHDYYRIFTRIVSRQTKFYPTLIANFDDRFFNGKEVVFRLNKGPESYLNLVDADFDFRRGDTVMVKICTIDEACFKFWLGYQTEVGNGANPFASSFHEVESNIVGEGKGIWGGYGASIYQIINK